MKVMFYLGDSLVCDDTMKRLEYIDSYKGLLFVTDFNAYGVAIRDNDTSQEELMALEESAFESGILDLRNFNVFKVKKFEWVQKEDGYF